MLRDIVARLIDEQADMQTLPPADAEIDLVDQIESPEPDVLLLACEREKAKEQASRALDRNPRLKVMTLTGNGREATVFELRPHEQSLGTMSPESLVDAIRTGAAAAADVVAVVDADPVAVAFFHRGDLEGSAQEQHLLFPEGVQFLVGQDRKQVSLE